MRKKTNKWNIVLVYILPCIILLFLCFFHIKDSRMIRIVGDEYGYWAAAAYMNGLDWAPVTSYNSYYGYGYGIILAIILKLGLPTLTNYQAAIVVNGFLLCGIYCLAYKIVSKLASNLNNGTRVIIGFASTVYAGILYYTQYNMSEVLISFLYWLILWQALKLIEKVTISRSIIFIILVVYSFSIHQRLIGLCFVCVVFWLWCVIRKKLNRRVYITSIIVAILSIVSIFVFKEFYKDAFYAGGGSINFSVNDFSGQTEKIQQLFSVSGMWQFIKAFSGKIYYSMSSSFLLVSIPCLVWGKQTISYLQKKNKVDKQQYPIISFLIVNWLIIMIIGSIYMLDYYQRFDHVIYGRYIEYSIGPLIMVALIYLFQAKIKNIKRFLLSLFIYIPIVFGIEFIADYERPLTHTFINCAGIADVLLLRGEKRGGLIWIAVRAILLFLVLCLVVQIEKNKNKIISLCIVGCISLNWIYISNYAYEQGCLPWSKEEEKKNIAFVKQIEQLGAEDSLYYYITEDVLKADVLQFLLKDSTIHCIEEQKDIISLSDTDYILTVHNTELKGVLEENNYKEIGNSGSLLLWDQVDLEE